MSRYRLCIGYIVSSLLIGTFIFTLINNNLKSEMLIKELQQKLEDMAAS